MNVSFTENAREDYLYWQKMDQKSLSGGRESYDHIYLQISLLNNKKY